jgi:hypothetical protein
MMINLHFALQDNAGKSPELFTLQGALELTD